MSRNEAPAVDLVDWRDFSAVSLPPLLQSAVESFVQHGYHGTTMRVLASHIGLSVPGLYHHYDSKQAMLIAIMKYAMDDLFSRSSAALAEAGGSVLEQFRLHVECLVLFHAHRGALAFLAASEIRALQPDARSEHIAARDRQQQMLADIVELGVEQGLFAAEYSKDTSRAIITMCTGIAQWYSRKGPLSPEELADRYVVIAQRSIGQRS
jgi:AcrR family transcriptional regulator